MQFAIGVSLKHFGRCRSHGTGSVWDSCRKIAWVLKNSFQGISITKFVRKLLNVRSPQTLEFAEITALVPFSTPTGDFTQNGCERNGDVTPIIQTPGNKPYKLCNHARSFTESTRKEH